MKKEVYFSDKNYLLIDFQKSHLTEEYISWLNDKETVKYSRHRYSKHDMKSSNNYLKEQNNNNNLFLAIEAKNISKNKNEHIGNISVNFDFNNEHADISILIGKKRFWGKGIGYILISNLIKFLFNKKNIYIITCGTLSVNVGMIKLMEKLNMNPKTTIPGRFLMEGKRVDLVQGFITNSKFTKQL